MKDKNDHYITIRDRFSPLGNNELEAILAKVDPKMDVHSSRVHTGAMFILTSVIGCAIATAVPSLNEYVLPSVYFGVIPNIALTLGFMAYALNDSDSYNMATTILHERKLAEQK